MTKKEKGILKKFRSTNTIYEDYSIDIAPIAQTGESSQTDVVQSSGGKMFLTKGTKKQTRCIHLAVDSKEKDPVGKLYQQLDNVLAQARRDGQDLPEYKAPTMPKGKVLEKCDDYVCAVNNAQGMVEISLSIDLSKDVDFCSKLFKIYSNLSRCLHYNEDSLRKLCRQLAKRGTN